eukprot:554224-Pleurochrysis_carterae.AAC.1
MATRKKRCRSWSIIIITTIGIIIIIISLTPTAKLLVLAEAWLLAPPAREAAVVGLAGEIVRPLALLPPPAGTSA